MPRASRMNPRCNRCRRRWNRCFAKSNRVAAVRTLDPTKSAPQSAPEWMPRAVVILRLNKKWTSFIACTISGIVIPGREHNHDRKYGFRACAKWRIHDVQLHIGG